MTEEKKKRAKKKVDPTLIKLPSMRELKYHAGMKLAMYPSDKQKQYIEFNTSTDRFIHNCKINDGRQIWYHNCHLVHDCPAYQIDPSLYRLGLVGQHRAYIAYMFDEFSTGLNYWFSRFRKSLSNKELIKYYEWMNKPAYKNRKKSPSNRLLDTLMVENVDKKISASWNQFMKVANTRIPTFHSKKSYTQNYQTSACYLSNHNTQLLNGTVRFEKRKSGMFLHLPKLGWVRVSGSYQRYLDLNKKHPIRIGTVTITHLANDTYQVSLQLGSDYPFVNVKKQAKHAIQDLQMRGIDFNTSKFASMTDLFETINPRFYRRKLKRLRRLNKSKSRKQRRAKKEGRKLSKSKNYQKARIKAAKLQRHIANQREDFLQNWTTEIIENQDFIVTEDLRSSNLKKNHAMAMSISDVGWRRAMEMLDYKCEQLGKIYLKVNPKYTTQMCSNCGFRMGTHGTHKIKLGIEEWTCPHCGVHHFRDLNAAKNILIKGINKYLDQTSMSKKTKQAARKYLANKFSLPNLK